MSDIIHLIDTHCHLTNTRFEDRDGIITGLREHGVWTAMTIGTGIADARACLDLRNRFSGVIAAAAGLDPWSCHEAAGQFDQRLAELDQLLATKQFSALGEIGLEYHHEMAPRAQQIAHFEAQLELAQRYDLPVVVHIRDGRFGDAHADAIDVLARHPRNRGVIHSFSGTPPIARKLLDLDWHLSFNGMLTYKGNDELRSAAALVPADHLLVETDAPYLPPIPHRGKRNEPAWVAHTAAFLAELRGERDDDIRAWTTRNACRLFRFDLPPEWSAQRPGHG